MIRMLAIIMLLTTSSASADNTPTLGQYLETPGCRVEFTPAWAQPPEEKTPLKAAVAAGYTVTFNTLVLAAITFLLRR